MDYNATFDMDGNLRAGAFDSRPAPPDPPLPEIGARVEVLFGVGSAIAWRAGRVMSHELRGYPERPEQCVRVEIDGHGYLAHPRSIRRRA